MSEFEVGLKLRADGQGLTGQLRLTREQATQLNTTLNDTNNAGRRAGSGLDRYGRNASEATRRSRSLKNETSSLTRRFVSLRGILATVGLVAFGRDLLRTTAEVQNIDTRIRGLSRSTADYAQNQSYLLGVSRDLRRELSTVSNSYAGLLTLEKANIVTRNEAREILEGMIDVQARAGASSVQLGQAMYGMQQGFSSGILRAEELNQVTEPLPGLLQELDKAAGLAGGGFRQLVVDGEVTSKMFKEELIEAFEAYEGAALETYNNLSQMWASLATEYQVMAKELQSPLTDSLAPLVNASVEALRSLADNMPLVLETLSTLTDLVMIGGALYIGLAALPVVAGLVSRAIGVASFNLAAFVLGVRAGVTPLEMMNIQLWGGASAASAFSSKMALAKASLLGIGAFFVGYEIGGLLNNFQMVRVAALQFVRFSLTQMENLKFAGKATWATFGSAFDEATSGIKLGYADMLEFIADGLDLVGADRMAQTYQAYADNLRGGADAEGNLAEQMRLLNEERDSAIAGVNTHINALLDLEIAGVNTTKPNEAVVATIIDLEDAAGGATGAVVGLTESQSDLLKELLPLHAAQLEYQASLEMLNSIVPQSTEEAQLKADALRELNAEYDELINPTKYFIENLEEEVTWLEEENEAIRSGNFLRLAEIELRRQGVDVTDEQIASMAELMRRQQSAEFMNGQLTDQADPFGEAWLETVRRVDRAWYDFVRSGFDGFKNFKDKTIDLAKDLVAELVVIYSRQKLFGGVLGAGASGFAGSASASPIPGLNGSGGSGGFGLTDILSLVSGSQGVGSLIGGAANLSFMASNGLNAIGLEGLGNMAANQGMNLATNGSQFGSLQNIGLSMLGGIAGNYAGNALGQALFNKQAESNIGSTIGGTAGGIIGGPIGAFIGSTLGALVDTAFGGDGMKRYSLGIGAGGADPVKGKHISGRSVLDSGLEISHVTRRVDSELLDPMLETFKAIDSTFSEVTRASGRTIDYSSLGLDGLNADAGSDAGGSFFGLRGENGLPANAEELIKGQFEDFTKQLIANVPGLNSEVIDIIAASTGDAEQILEQYRDLLALDSIFGAGSQIFTDIETFEQTFEFFGDTLQREGEGLMAAAQRVGASMLLLQQIGVGSGSSSDAEFANLVESELGLERLSTLIAAYSDAYLSESESLGASVEILTKQVNEQFTALDLSLENFTTLDSFREQFDSVRDSLDAVDLSKYLEAAVSLSQLIELREQETEAIRDTSGALTEFGRTVNDIESIVEQARALSRDFSNQINKLKGAEILRPELGVGSAEEQLSAVLELRSIYEQQHADRVSAERELFDIQMRNYEERTAAQESLDKYIRGLGFSDFAPVTGQERLQAASDEFDLLFNQARNGDISKVGDAQNAAQNLLTIAREQFASGQAFEDIFFSTRDKLSDLSGLLSGGSSPGEFSTPEADQLLITQLESLQVALVGVEREGSIEIINQLLDLNLTVADLSTDLLEQLASIASADVLLGLQTATNFGLLRTEVTEALGLLPTELDLSQTGIANALESLTSIGDMREIFTTGFASLSAIIGSVATTMISGGASPTVVADVISGDPTLTDATNTHLDDIGSDLTVGDFTSKNNPSITDAQIADFIGTQINNPLGPRNVIEAAIANGVGSAQLVGPVQDFYPGLTQQDIIDIAIGEGLGSFSKGTDRMKKSGLNFNHVDEMIFSRPEANDIRSNVNAIVAREASNDASKSNAKLVAAIREQSALIEKLMTLFSSQGSEAQTQMAGLIESLQEEIEAMRRELENKAA